MIRIRSTYVGMALLTAAFFVAGMPFSHAQDAPKVTITIDQVRAMARALGLLSISKINSQSPVAVNTDGINGAGPPFTPSGPPFDPPGPPPCTPPHASPCHPGHGNNGVGNGQDPPPPGNPPINDGPGTGPGNPGNRGGN